MINYIIAFSIKNKFIIGLLTIALVVAGIWSMTRVPLDAVPDITNNQVQVISQAPNLGTEDIEQFITYPIEVAMSNLPGVTEIRSVSRFGLSVVTIVFDDDMGTYLPRQLVSEKLIEVREEIPPGFGEVAMGPIATGLGEIYQYTLAVAPEYQDKYTALDLRTMQDWIVRRQMAMVPGVIEVNGFGGAVKQYEVAVNPDELRAIGVTISDVFEALEKNNKNTGGAYIEKDHAANFIRGEGLARDVSDIESIVVKTTGSVPIRIADIAKVRFGNAVRYGAFTKDGEGEAVGGIIFMLKGANSNKVIRHVKERMQLIEESLPEGVTIEPFLDRSRLISETTGTVTTNLVEGALIVIFVLVFLLGNWRGGLIVASTIPLSLLFAFIMMNAFDVWANLMSLGAIDFGIIVDGAVIIVEGTVFYFSHEMSKGNIVSRNEVAFRASSKMMNAAFFGQLIILIVFLPVLFLEGVEGKMFRPMALTFMFAMLGAIILCLTYVPMMSALLIKASEKEKPSRGDRIVHWIERNYEKTLALSLRRIGVVFGSAALLFGLTIFTFTRMGSEFIPQLDEGDIAFHILLKPGSSLTESIKTSTQIETMLLKNFPEVKHAMTRFGVADVPTDPMPMDMGDCFIILKPKDEWVSAKTKEELIEKMKKKLELVPGVSYEFSQPIEMRFNELISGVREDIAIKLYGEDLNVLAAKADEIGRIIGGIEGIGDMKVEATSGLPQMVIHYERENLAQYGLSVDDANRAIETAFAGGKAGVIFEGEKRFDLVVRLDAVHRTQIDDLKNLYVNTSSGAQIPLSEIARIRYESGPMQISRDNTNRRVHVGVNVRGRDVKSLVEEIRATLDQRLQLPAGYYIRYGGAFENLERATQRLQVVVPIALALIFILIYFALHSLRETFMIYVAIPLAAIGGVFSLWVRDMPFSISAGVGFIVLFGVAVLNGLVLVSGWNELKAEGVSNLDERIIKGARRRIRPILLTALADVLGFLPMAVSKSAGAEVQQPLATVVIGGMVTSTLLTLIVLPSLYRMAERRSFKLSANMIVILFTIGIIGFGAVPSQAQSQDTLPAISMDDAVAKAVRNYPRIEAARLQIEQQQALKRGAWDLGNTQIYTGGEELRNGDGVYTTVGIQQQNIDLFGIAPKLDLQNQRVALSEAALSLNEIELIREVRNAYANAYVTGKTLQLYMHLDSIYREFERAARLRYEVEETSKLAYLAALNQVRQIELQRIQLSYDFRSALAKLNLWLVSDTLYTISLENEPSWAAPIVVADSLKSHPLLDIATRQVDVAEAERRVASANMLPKLNGQYGDQSIDGERGYYQFQIGISIPLFFAPDRARIQSAKFQRRIAEQDRLETQAELRAQFNSVMQDYRKWLASWRFYETEALPLAREQRRGAMLAFREGSIDYVSFIQNLKEAVQVEVMAQDARLKYLESKFELEYYSETSK